MALAALFVRKGAGIIHTAFYMIEKSVVESARALLIDPQDRVLLIQLALGRMAIDAIALHQTVWLTPGGSLHPGESFEDALLREIFEETGLHLDHPGHWVWTSPKRIVRDGQPVDTGLLSDCNVGVPAVTASRLWRLVTNGWFRENRRSTPDFPLVFTRFQWRTAMCLLEPAA